MSEPTIKQRLAGLRERKADIEWRSAVPGVSAADEDALEWLEREIARLEEYEQPGYEHEPNF